MKNLTKPKRNVADVLGILKSDTTRGSTINEIESIIAILSEREVLYEQKVLGNTLFEIPRIQNISALVDKNKIISYYEYRLLNKPNGRLLYDEIMQSAPYEICPFCTMRKVKTIDHFLPKSEYPSYAITPLNLVPCCRDCNMDKKISYPTDPKNQTFHPYFDNVENECWLKAKLMQTEPLSFQFEVIKPANWDDVKFCRAVAHFNDYNINEIFSSNANRELRAMQDQFRNLYIKDKRLLKTFLEDSFKSCQNGAGLIDFKTLVYKELATKEWFLNGCLGNSFFNK